MIKKVIPTILSLIIFLATQTSYGWTGYDFTNDRLLEVQKGTLVRPGRVIPLYDMTHRVYITVKIISVSRNQIVYIDPKTSDIVTVMMQ